MSEIKEDTIILTDELGNELTARIILSFESDEFNKSYVVYQMIDGDDDEEYHAASFNPDDGEEGELGQIETDEEWDLIEEVLESFLEDEEDEENEEEK